MVFFSSFAVFNVTVLADVAVVSIDVVVGNEIVAVVVNNIDVLDNFAIVDNFCFGIIIFLTDQNFEDVDGGAIGLVEAKVV